MEEPRGRAARQTLCGSGYISPHCRLDQEGVDVPSLQASIVFYAMKKYESGDQLFYPVMPGATRP